MISVRTAEDLPGVGLRTKRYDVRSQEFWELFLADFVRLGMLRKLVRRVMYSIAFLAFLAIAALSWRAIRQSQVSAAMNTSGLKWN